MEEFGKNFYQKNPQDKNLPILGVLSKHEIKLSHTVFKGKCCQNWCKTVVFKNFQGQISGVGGGGDSSSQKNKNKNKNKNKKIRDTCQMGFPTDPDRHCKSKKTPTPQRVFFKTRCETHFGPNIPCWMTMLSNLSFISALSIIRSSTVFSVTNLNTCICFLPAAKDLWGRLG